VSLGAFCAIIRIIGFVLDHKALDIAPVVVKAFEKIQHDGGVLIHTVLNIKIAAAHDVF